MTTRALTFLSIISMLCVAGLVVSMFSNADNTNVVTTLSTVLTGSVIAIAALVTPQRPSS